EAVEMVRPRARWRVGLPQHPRSRVIAHALNGGFRGEASEQGLVEAAAPAVIVSEHAEGFEHLAMLAGTGEIAALEHAVDGTGQLLDGLGQGAPLELDGLCDAAG